MIRITGRFKSIRENSASLSVIFAVFGIILLVFFLKNVDNGTSTILLFAGAVLLSLGMTYVSE